jgi:hypothetical protein
MAHLEVQRGGDALQHMDMFIVCWANSRSCAVWRCVLAPLIRSLFSDSYTSTQIRSSSLKHWGCSVKRDIFARRQNTQAPMYFSWKHGLSHPWPWRGTLYAYPPQWYKRVPWITTDGPRRVTLGPWFFVLGRISCHLDYARRCRSVTRRRQQWHVQRWLRLVVGSRESVNNEEGAFLRAAIHDTTWPTW